MKIEWEKEDIRPGLIVGRPKRAERCMIGYLPGEGGPERWTLNSLQDGRVHGPFDAETLAAQLTKTDELPAEVLDNPKMELS